MNQAVREKTVERLKKGQIDIIVATDVAARGLDVERISHVVNYDIPYDTEAYIHRIGRTGRAGRKGTAILFVAPREKRMLYAIEKATRQPITPMQLPSRESIADRRIERFKQGVSEVIEAGELDFFEEIILAYQQERNLDLVQIAAALAYLVQRDKPLQPAGDGRQSKAGRKAAAQPQTAPPAAADRPRSRKTPLPQAPAAQTHQPPHQPDEDEPMPPLETYRVEVGLEHGVKPKHIVGAIANEADLDSRYIGRVQLFDTYSLVDLPEGMPKEVARHLRKVWVCGRQLWLKRLAGQDEAPDIPRKQLAKAKDKTAAVRTAGKKSKSGAAAKKPRKKDRTSRREAPKGRP